MVDLPIPDQPDVMAQTPTQRVSGFQYARSGSFLAAGLDRLSQGLSDVAVNAAKDQAASDLQSGNIVTRDAQGNITVGKPAGLPIMGPAGEAYRSAIAAGTLAQGHNLVDQDLTAIATQHQGDPQGLLKAGQSYISNLTARTPGPVGVAMANHANDLLTQHYDGAVARQAQVDTEASKQSIVSARTTAYNTLLTLAEQGGENTPAYKKALADWNALGTSLTTNPAFGVDAKTLAASDKGDLSTLQGYHIAGSVDRDIPQIGVNAALQKAQASINDPSIDLSPAERQKFLAIAEGRVHFFQAANSGDIEANKANAHAMMTDVASGRQPPPPPAIVQAVIAKSKALGDFTTAAQISAAQAVWEYNATKRTMSPEQQLRAQGIGPIPTAPSLSSIGEAQPGGGAAAGGGRVGGTTGANYLSALSRGDVMGALRASEGLRTDAYWDVNHWRTGYGSDTITGPDGSASPVGGVNGGNPNMKPSVSITAEDAERDLQRRTGDYAQGAAKVIGPAWQNFTPATKAALTSIAYNYGHVPSDVAAAAASGDTQAIAAAIRAHANDNSGANFSRRQAEAAAVLGQTAPGAAPPAVSANGFPFTKAQVDANPFLVSSWIQAQARDPANRIAAGKAVIEAQIQALNNGFVPELPSAAMAVQLAQSHPELQPLADKLQGAIAGHNIAQKLDAMEPGMAEATLGALHNYAQNTPDILHTTMAEIAQKEYRADVEMRDKHTVQYAVQKGLAKEPMPFNFDDANALAVGFHQRADLMDAVARESHGSLTGSLLDKDSTDQIRAQIASGTGQQLQNITAALTAAPDARRGATIAALGPAIMGAANSGDPDKMKAAYDFMRQQFTENPVNFRKDFGKEAANQMLAYQNAIQFLPPDVAAKRVQGWTDPAQEEARRGLAEAAKKELSTVSADQVAQKWSTFSYLKPWAWGGTRAQVPTTDAAATSGDGLRNDYAQAYTFQRQLGMDAAHAETNALQMLSTKWGVSGVNGNVVMAHPPEALFPAINGSHAWISEQLDKDVFDATRAGENRAAGLARYGSDTAEARQRAMTEFDPLHPDTADQASRIATYRAPRALAADSTTEADINAHRPPSYYIVTQDSKGLWNPLVDKNGVMVRFRPDPQSSQDFTAARAQAKHIADEDAAWAAFKDARHREAWGDAPGSP